MILSSAKVKDKKFQLKTVSFITNYIVDSGKKVIKNLPDLKLFYDIRICNNMISYIAFLFLLSTSNINITCGYQVSNYNCTLGSVDVRRWTFQSDPRC